MSVTARSAKRSVHFDVFPWKEGMLGQRVWLACPRWRKQDRYRRSHENAEPGRLTGRAKEIKLPGRLGVVVVKHLVNVSSNDQPCNPLGYRIEILRNDGVIRLEQVPGAAQQAAPQQ